MNDIAMTTGEIEQEHAQLADGGNQYLTFKLNGQDYGVPITTVQEIKGWATTTPVPNSPDYIVGVLNLRGTIIPVISLRERFGLPKAHHDDFTVIIVVNMGSRLGGLIVDGVSDVINANEESIQPNPESGNNEEQRFFNGLIETSDHLVILLDVAELSEDIIDAV